MGIVALHYFDILISVWNESHAARFGTSFPRDFQHYIIM